VLVRVDQPGGKPVAEDVALSLVASVERLRVPAIQAMEAGRELRSGGLDDEVVVRPHETEGMDTPLEPLADLGEQSNEVPPVIVAGEQPALVDRVTGDVVDAVRELASERSGHVAVVDASEDDALEWCTGGNRHTFDTHTWV
jgi:hypothetical protein